MRVRGNSAFRVTIRREGRPDEVITGVAGNGRHNQTVTVVEVERPGDDAPPADAPPHAPPSSRNPFE